MVEKEICLYFEINWLSAMFWEKEENREKRGGKKEKDEREKVSDDSSPSAWSESK